MVSLLLLTSGGSSSLGNTSDLVLSALDFLLLLSSDLWLLDESVSSEVSLGVVLLLGIEGVVDESESGGSASSELGVASEDGDGLSLCLEHGGELLLHLNLGDVGHVWMDHLNHKLLSSEKWVLDHLSGVENEFTFNCSHLFVI